MSTEAQEAAQPAQHQDRQPGIESEMRPRPRFDDPSHRGSGRLLDKRALITGGDSGIGRAVAVSFAREGADIAIVYLDEHDDAKETVRLVKKEGREAIALSADVGQQSACRRVVAKTVETLGGLDIVVNNAAEQHPCERLEEITSAQLERTFRTNVYSMFYVTSAALGHLKSGDSIINTASVTAFRGSGHLVDYASSKGAIIAFTRSLSAQLVDRGIRVNAVAPGPVWTPLIPASFDAEHVATFGTKVPMGRVGQPVEIAGCFLFLASDDSSYMTGQVLHPNGGEVVGS